MLNSPHIYPINSKPLGLSYEEWTIRWWLWLLGIPKYKNPTLDLTGIFANTRQYHRPVFFLCQTFESSFTIPYRSLMIPKGSSIFIPLINWISIMPEDGINVEDLIKKANQKMDVVRDLNLSINGESLGTNLKRYRVRSGPFTVELPSNNILDLDAGNKMAYSDGYWVMTKPLDKTTILTTFGSCTLGLTRIGVNYEIRIL